ncbi:MAG: formate/nitrite transporter family protein [Synergistes sp.]|nr:formate/nitrite transporter family protein [Synergistes sp.]
MAFKTPVEIAKSTVEIGCAKARMPLQRMWLLGLLAGAYIAMGGYFMIVVTQDASQFAGVGISKLLGGLVFAMGLFLVVSAGAELFTGNCLLTVGVLSKKITLREMCVNLFVVYLANFLGAFIFAQLIFFSGTLSEAAAANALNIAVTKTGLPFGEMFVRGVLCNWFVCIAVWVTFGAMDMAGKFISLLMPIAAFVAMGFEHCVANMFFLPLGYFIDSAAGGGQLTVALLFRNLIPVSIANMVGGMVLVGLIYYLAFEKELLKKN